MQVLENKIPPPIVTVLFGLAMWASSLVLSPVDVNEFARVAMSLAFVALGIFVDIAGLVSFRHAKTTVNPLKPATATSLVDSGIYMISRNPMYVGMAFYLVAWAVYLSSPLVGIGVFGFVLYMNRFQIAPEERALVDIFGSEYENYQEKVRRWL